MFEIKYDKDGQPIPGKEPVVEELVNLQQPVAPDEVEQVQEDLAQETAPEQQETPIESAQESSAERNHRALRELKEKAEKERIRAEKERDEAILRARKLEEQYARPTQKSDNDDVDINIGEEDLVEGKHVRKIAREIRELKKELEASRSQNKIQSLQDRLQREYPDFDRVVTQENIELLRHLKPRQAQLLDSSSDMYTTAASAYEMIKEYGIYQEQQRVQHDRNLVHKNIAKPRPTNSISPQRGDSPLTKAHDFANGWGGQDSTDAKAIYKEMLQAMKSR